MAFTVASPPETHETLFTYFRDGTLGIPKRPRPAAQFCDVHHPAYWWRKIASRRQPNPELIEVCKKSSLEVLCRLCIYSGRFLVGANILPRPQNSRFGTSNGLALVMRLLPKTSWATAKASTPQPIRSDSVTESCSLLQATSRSVPIPCNRHSRPQGVTTRPSPLATGRQVLPFHEEA